MEPFDILTKEEKLRMGRQRVSFERGIGRFFSSKMRKRRIPFCLVVGLFCFDPNGCVYVASRIPVERFWD